MKYRDSRASYQRQSRLGLFSSVIMSAQQQQQKILGKVPQTESDLVCSGLDSSQGIKY